MQSPDSIKIYAYLNSAWVELDEIAPIRVSYGFGDNSPSTRIADVGEMTFALNNETGQYSPNNPSVLSGWARGVFVKLVVSYLGDRTKFYGVVSDIDLDTRHKRVNVTCLDWLDIATKYPVVNPELLQNTDGSAAIESLLESMPIQPLATSLETGVFEFPTIFDTVQGYTKAYSEFAKIASSELGYVYRKTDTVYGDTLVFEPMDYRNGTRSIKSILVSYSGFLKKSDGDFLLKSDSGKISLSINEAVPAIFEDVDTAKEIVYGDEIVNRFVAQAYPKRSDTEPVLIYESENDIRLAGGESKTFRILWRDPTGKRPINAYPPSGTSTTKALVHFTDRSGDSGDANFLDETGKIWTPTDAEGVSTPVKFGSRAVYFDGSGSYLSSPNSVDWEMGSGDFCIDWWEYRYNVNSSASVSRDGGTGYQPWILGVSNGSSLLVYMSSNGSSWDVANGQSLGSITTDTWNHFAVSREGSTFRAFKNGVQTSTWTSSASLVASSSAVYIGKYGSASITAIIDEFRITKGEAVYTAGFTPPTSEYSVVGSIYNLWSQQSSTGTDLAQYLSVSAVYGTEGATFTIGNTGTATGYLKVKVYGYGIYSDSPLEYAEENTTSVDSYGYQSANIQQAYQQDIYAGILEGRRVVELLKSPRTVLKKFTTCANINSVTMSAFLNVDIGDLVRIVISGDDIDSLFYVHGVEFSIKGNVIFFSWVVQQAWTLADGYDLITLEMDGTGDAVNYGYIAQTIPSNRGISAWFNLTGIDASNDRVILSNGDGFALYVDNHASTRYLVFERGFSTTDGVWKCPGDAFSLSAWVHVFVSYDDSSTSNNPVIYINGVSQSLTESSTPDGTALPEIGAALVVGNYPNSGGAFYGQIKDVRVYNLTDSSHTAAALASGIYAEGAAGSGYYSGMKFIAPVVRSEDLSSLVDVTLSDQKLLDGYIGAVGTPAGNPIVREI